EHTELTARVVVAVVGVRREHDAEAEIISRGLAQDLGKDRNHLCAPEKLILDVDEPAGVAKGSHVRLEDTEVATRQGFVRVFRDGAHELHATGPSGRWGGNRREAFPGGGLPAQGEMCCDVCHRGAAEAGDGIMPAQSAATGMW